MKQIIKDVFLNTVDINKNPRLSTQSRIDDYVCNEEYVNRILQEAGVRL